MSTGNFPATKFGRRSHNMSEDDWRQMATAYDVWNDHAACEDEIDEDLKKYVKSVFSSYGLWDYNSDEPMLGSYRQMFMTLC